MSAVTVTQSQKPCQRAQRAVSAHCFEKPRQCPDVGCNEPDICLTLSAFGHAITRFVPPDGQAEPCVASGRFDDCTARRVPRCSALTMIDNAMRSLIDPPGFWLSILTKRRHLPVSNLFSSTTGVSPIRSSTDKWRTQARGRLCRRSAEHLEAHAAAVSRMSA